MNQEKVEKASNVDEMIEIKPGKDKLWAVSKVIFFFGMKRH